MMRPVAVIVAAGAVGVSAGAAGWADASVEIIHAEAKAISARPTRCMYERSLTPRARPGESVDRGRVSGDDSAVIAIDLTGKRALVAGVGDERGFGFAIARALG